MLSNKKSSRYYEEIQKMAKKSEEKPLKSSKINNIEEKPKRLKVIESAAPSKISKK